MNSRLITLLLIIFLVQSLILAQQPDQKNLPIDLTPFENSANIGRAIQTPAPQNPIRALGEWEESEYAMVLWVNPSLIANLAKRGKVKILADTQSDVSWWDRWLANNKISQKSVSYFVVPTNSIWIRDYGPWYILDGAGNLGMVDTKYNRPRPQDDIVPEFISRETGIPNYQPGLVHTGGNFYSDGLGNGFSSTLVYTENRWMTKEEVNERMKDYLGINRYITGRLAPGITIEHFDTFGKLVAPDTIVFSDFPQGSKYRRDSEAMVAKLKTLKSPYGTDYKIHRMKMVPRGGGDRDYRAFINSFISNKVLYYPIYANDQHDAHAKEIYQNALPGYEIVGVDAKGTGWGDSVHCRTRNIMKRNTIFVFPNIAEIPNDRSKAIQVTAEIFASPGANIRNHPKLHYRINNSTMRAVNMELKRDRVYAGTIPAQPKGTQVSFFVEVEDTNNVRKTAPMTAPHMTIDFEIK